MAKEKLLKSQIARDDEYYTLYDDIASEVSLYKAQLRGKHIICPCDWDECFDENIVFINPKNGPPYKIDVAATQIKYNKSTCEIPKCNFIKYLVSQADIFGIASISASGYYPAIDKGLRFQNVDFTKYDIVITNPPFSLFREFIEKMFSDKVKFLVIGPQNAITYRDIFDYIKTNQMWLGYSKQLTGFMRDNGELILSKNPEGSVPRACKWFTNLDVSYRRDKMILTEKYNSNKFPNYYNYDAIDVAKTAEIPEDWPGEMGVPITFLQKYNPTQFEIIGKGVQLEKTRRFNGDKATLWIEKDGKPFKAPFERIIIRNKEVVNHADEN